MDESLPCSGFLSQVCMMGPWAFGLCQVAAGRESPQPGLSSPLSGPLAATAATCRARHQLYWPTDWSGVPVLTLFPDFFFCVWNKYFVQNIFLRHGETLFFGLFQSRHKSRIQTWYRHPENIQYYFQNHESFEKNNDCNNTGLSKCIHLQPFVLVRHWWSC